MPRVPRSFYSTNFLHITVQGIEKKNIFYKSKYRDKYINLIMENKERYNIIIISHCVMTNHAHIIIYQNEISDVSNFMKSINTSYANYFNKIEERVGHVFRNRFSCEAINDINYLYNCIGYVHNNPVKAGIVKKIGDYKHSSYNDYINHTGIVNDKVIELVFDGNKNYLDIFLEINKNSQQKFLDENEEFLDSNYVISEFFSKRNIDKSDIYINNSILKKLVLELNIKSGLSIRKISDLLKIPRTRIMKVLKKC